MTSQPTLSLRDKTEMPAFGLGTWKSKPGEVYDAVKVALSAGYRHIDCAAVYGNENEVGQAIEDSLNAGVITRDELWVTSKLWNNAHLFDDVRPALEQTLADLRLDFIDLYLIHWPIAFRPGVGFPAGPEDWLTLKEAPLEKTWEAMIEVKKAGLTAQIGVSNMGPERIELLTGVGEAPAVNQVESHPHLQQRDLLEFCSNRDIVLTAYSPLGSTDREHRKDDEPALLEHPIICEIAEELDASAAQILIKWAVERGTVVIPKSVNPGRIEENLASLELSLTDEQMKAIAEMDKGYRYLDGEFFTKKGSPYSADGIWR